MPLGKSRSVSSATDLASLSSKSSNSVDLSPDSSPDSDMYTRRIRSRRRSYTSATKKISSVVKQLGSRTPSTRRSRKSRKRNIFGSISKRTNRSLPKVTFERNLTYRSSSRAQSNVLKQSRSIVTRRSIKTYFVKNKQSKRSQSGKRRTRNKQIQFYKSTSKARSNKTMSSG